MAVVLHADTASPLSEMNTTPLIDVLLVLLIMLIMTIPIATHEVPVELPADCPHCRTPPNPLHNKITIDTAGRIHWNGEQISQPELAGLLRQTTLMAVEPELQFEPAANASYDIAARVLATIKKSGVTNFGFIGNERYRSFGKSD
jgi:biopolymer transport protein ExbD